MGVSIQRLAEEAEVSIATVSRVLNGKPYVKRDVQERVLDVARRLNYTPKAKSPTLRIPMLIELRSGKDMGVYESLLIARVTRLLAEQGCHLELVQPESHSDLRDQFTKAALALSYSKRAAQALADCETPLISINNPIKGAFNIYSDHCEDGYMAAERLLKLGHRRLGLCVSHIDGWGRNERVRGYKKALKDFGVSFDEALVADDAEDPSYLRAASGLLRQGATAIAALGHEIGFHVAHSLFILGRRIPEDVSLVATENQLLSACLVPPQTAVAQPIYEMAAMAVEAAVSVARGERFKARDVVMRNSLVERGSEMKLKERRSA